MATLTAQNADATPETWIALLGRRDTPADGVEDYCAYLSAALAQRGVQLQLTRVQWMERGWVGGLWRLWREGSEWRGKWVLLQYTALGWSRRGFPLGAVAALAILRRRGARCAVVFHEPERHGGPRWIDRFRGACQDWVVRKLYRFAAKGIFADPLETVGWLRDHEHKAVFISIGANIPNLALHKPAALDRNGATKTVAVFCLSGLPNQRREVGDIANAVRLATTAGAKVRVIFLGRGTAEAAKEIESGFSALPVEVSNIGLQEAHEVSRVLAESDVMICVRGKLYPRRGSALAGVACGLPIVGYAGAAEGTPLAEAGLALVPYLDRKALGEALWRVLTDEALASKLRRRSREAHSKFFSWDAIASGYVSALGKLESPSRPFVEKMEMR